MIARVARLVTGEFIKLLSHPFLYIALAIVAAATVLSAWLQPIVTGQGETPWRTLHAIQLFAYSFSWGLKTAGFALVIFSSMMFAGEFDRGTIKNLLTRPITRTDFFAAKCVTVLALGTGLFLFVLYLSLAYAFLRGDLGPVWDGSSYLIQRPYEMIAAIARKAVVMSFPPFLAAGFLGILVSNWTESSGYAVAVAVILFFLGGIVTDQVSPDAKTRSFLYYAPYVLDKLRLYAEGGQEYWDEKLETGLLYVKVPLAYIAGFLPVAFAIFHRRNIHA